MDTEKVKYFSTCKHPTLTCACENQLKKNKTTKAKDDYINGINFLLSVPHL